MFDLKSMSSQLVFCTVRIEGTMPNGECSVGTAFFFSFQYGNSKIPVLVTNRHVVNGCSQGEFLLHEAAQDGKTPLGSSFAVTLDRFEERWFEHPNKDVDLCVMPVAPLWEAANSQEKSIFRIELTEQQIPSDETLASLVALEDVIMVGYPIGLWDSTNNLPILRRGITASHPSVDFEGRSEGMIDIAAFSGSSGSPVVILNEGSYSTPGGIVLGSRFLFLGILHGGPQYAADGALEIVQIPTVQTHRISVFIPVHLGAYIKSRALVAIGQELGKYTRSKPTER